MDFWARVAASAMGSLIGVLLAITIIGIGVRLWHFLFTCRKCKKARLDSDESAP